MEGNENILFRDLFQIIKYSNNVVMISIIYSNNKVGTLMQYSYSTNVQFNKLKDFLQNCCQLLIPF